MIWFPGFKSWLKALVLIVALIPVRIFFLVIDPPVAYVLGRGHYLYLWNHTYSEEWRFWAWFAVVGVFVPIAVLSHVYQWLWGNSSTKLTMWLEGFLSWLVVIISMLICVCVFIFRYYGRGFPSELTDQDAIGLTAVFVISAAYLYHFRFISEAFIKRRWAAIKHWLDTV